MAQLVNNPPAMWETWVQLLSWEPPSPVPGGGHGNPFNIAFLGGSEGKESACNAGDPSSIPGLGRFPEEENGNPL